MNFMGLDGLALLISGIALLCSALSVVYTRRQAHAAKQQAHEAKRQADETTRSNDLLAERMRHEAVRFSAELIPRNPGDYTLRIHNTGTQTAYVKKAVLTRIHTSYKAEFYWAALAPGASHDMYLFGKDFSLIKGCDLTIEWARQQYSQDIETWGPTSLTPPETRD